MPQCVGLSCRFSGRATIRGELALKRKHIIAAKARENYENYVGRPSKSCQNSDTIIEKIDTKKELAKIAGVSHDTIARVHESGRCTLPFRGGNIEGRPAGGGPGFSRTAGTCRATVRNPGALRGRLGAGVVAYVPRYGAYVTLSRAPRETALFPVHCCHSSLPGRYASAAYTPVCGGTGPDMARILPGSRPGREKTHLHRSPVVADLASPRRSTPPARRKGVIGRVVGWGCLLVIFRGGKIRGLIRSGSQDPEIRSIGKGGVAFALFPLPGAFFCRFGPVSSCLLWNTRR
jgi:hypothetical protein